MRYLNLVLIGILNTEPEDSIDYRIAKFLLEHIAEFEKFNATRIATECNVSKAAITRFCKHIGLEDFLDLQIMYRISNNSTRRTKFQFEGRGDSQNIGIDFLESSKRVIENLESRIDWKILDELVEDIRKFDRVATFGHMHSGNIAMNLQHDIFIAGKYLFSSHRFGVQRDFILNADSKTLIIIFSATGDYLDRTFPMEFKTSARIYLITVSKIDPKPNVYRTIDLCSRFDYATSILAMQEYANLIALKFNSLE